MKKNLIIFLLFCVMKISCKKHVFNYRDKFIGNYDLNVQYTSWWGGGGAIGGSTDTLNNSSGKVEMGNEDNTVLVSFPVVFFLKQQLMKMERLKNIVERLNS